MKRILVWVCAVACVGNAGCMWGQAASGGASAAPVKDPVTTALRMLYDRSRTNTLGAIGAMPADKFNYKPTPDQSSFGHLVAHIVGFNNSFCAKVAGVAEPKVEEAKETDAKDKLVAAATASYDFCNEALGKMDDSKMGESIEMFHGRQGPRALAVLILASGWSDHYSTAAMYLRLNGIAPPSAQPKK